MEHIFAVIKSKYIWHKTIKIVICKSGIHILHFCLQMQRYFKHSYQATVWAIGETPTWIELVLLVLSVEVRVLTCSGDLELSFASSVFTYMCITFCVKMLGDRPRMFQNLTVLGHQQPHHRIQWIKPNIVAFYTSIISVAVYHNQHNDSEWPTETRIKRYFYDLRMRDLILCLQTLFN